MRETCVEAKLVWSRTGWRDEGTGDPVLHPNRPSLCTVGIRTAVDLCRADGVQGGIPARYVLPPGRALVSTRYPTVEERVHRGPAATSSSQGLGPTSERSGGPRGCPSWASGTGPDPGPAVRGHPCQGRSSTAPSRPVPRPRRATVGGPAAEGGNGRAPAGARRGPARNSRKRRRAAGPAGRAGRFVLPGRARVPVPESASSGRRSPATPRPLRAPDSQRVRAGSG